MDKAIIQAFECLATRYRASADDILVDPELRVPFVAQVRCAVGELPEKDILHRLICLRKARKLTRSRDLLSPRDPATTGDAAP